MAAELLQLQEVPTIELGHLTETQKRAYIIADNKIALNAGWNEELLALELQDIFDSGFDLDLTGFDMDELMELNIDFGNDETPKQSNANSEMQDEVPEIEENPVIQYGDIIELGSHRLMCGDSTKDNDIKKLMKNDLADQLITDPPYNVAYEGKTQEALTIKNDSMDEQSFYAFLTDAFKCANNVMRDGAVFYIWHSSSFNFHLPCSNTGWKVRQNLVWVKNSMVMGRQDYHWQHEPCIYGWKDGAAHLWCNDRKQTTLLQFDRPIRNDIHPTMKPVNLFEYQIGNNTKEDDVVLDIFGGSGTTMIACENLKRKARIMELDPKYAQVIVQRWCDYTSNEKIKINGKQVIWSNYKTAS